MMDRTYLTLLKVVAGISQRRLGFAPGSVHVGLTVDKVALGQLFLRVLLFSSVITIPLLLSVLIYHLGMNNRPASGRNSER
jgi:hypothetical protein